MVVKVAMLMLLLNVFVWTGFRGMDMLVVSLGSAMLALAGWITAHYGRKKVRRRAGRGTSETMSLLAYWGNFTVFLLTFLLFSWSVAMGILRGDLL